MTDNIELSTSNHLRDHKAALFIEAYQEAESESERAELRKKLKRIDGGRWYDVLDEAHKHFAHGDYDSRDHYERIYGDEFLLWVASFGMVEDLNTFPKVTGVER